MTHSPRTEATKKRKPFKYRVCDGWMLVDLEGTYEDGFFFRRRDAVAEREANSFLIDAKWRIVPVRVSPR